MLTHWSQFNMLTDIRGHEALLHHLPQELCEGRDGRPGISVPDIPLWSL